MGKKELIGLSERQMRDFLSAWGERPYRARQLFHALYQERRWDMQAVTNFPARLRKRLAQAYQATLPRIEKRFQSSDGTTRYLLQLAEGGGIEAVLMPETNRDTICLSTQAGCPVDCKFCLTGVMGFQRNLTAGEIVGQVLLLIQDNGLETRKPEAAGKRRLNIVLMGMGEPLLNYSNVIAAVRLFSDPEAMGLSQGRMTLSTSGIVPGIRRLGQEPTRPQLAISLNATTDELRDRLMPVNRKWPIAELLQACREFPLRPREKLTFEYVLLEGVNDSFADARRLAGLVRGLRAKVNLIGLNPGSGLPFATPSDEHIHAFQQTVIRNGVPAYIRKPRGRDIFAACGQLKLEGAETAVPLGNGRG